MTDQHTDQTALAAVPGLPPIPPAPVVASHVLWHHMARGGKTPNVDTIRVLDKIDQALKYNEPQAAKLQHDYPVHYGYMYVARHMEDGLAILEGIAKEAEAGRG